MTKARRAVLEVLAAAESPLTAAEIFRRLPISADQATVYRTLHYLEDNGTADSFVLHCSSHGTERYYTAAVSSTGEPIAHRHWFHCEKCHRFTDLGDCRLAELMQGYEKEYGISVFTHTLYLTGECAECKGK